MPSIGNDMVDTKGSLRKYMDNSSEWLREEKNIEYGCLMTKKKAGIKQAKISETTKSWSLFITLGRLLNKCNGSVYVLLLLTMCYAIPLTIKGCQHNKFLQCIVKLALHWIGCNRKSTDSIPLLITMEMYHLFALSSGFD